jgi:hypothetical protein
MTPDLPALRAREIMTVMRRSAAPASLSFPVRPLRAAALLTLALGCGGNAPATAPEDDGADDVDAPLPGGRGGRGGTSGGPATGGTSGAPGVGGGAGGTSGTGGTVGAGGTSGTGGTSGAGGTAGTSGGGGDAGASTDARAAAPDVAPVDASPAGDAAPPGPAVGCPADAIVCDDFESQTAGSRPAGKWRSLTSAGGAVVADEKHAFSGKRALLFTAPAARKPEARIQPLGWAPFAKDDLWGRMMLYFEQVPGRAPGTPAHFALVRGEGAGLVWARIGGSNQDGAAAVWGANYFGNGCDQGRSSRTQLPKGKWVCYEWHWRRTDNAWAVWVDGAPIRELTFTQGANASCWKVPVINTMNFGWIQEHATSSPLALWMDDVALAEKRLGCPPPGGR